MRKRMLISISGLFLLGSPFSLLAQTRTDAQERPSKDSILKEYDALQKQQAGGEDVSLDPNTVIDIISKYPSLRAEVKRKLIQKAYEQGRILEEEDLTDSILFDLIRRDSRVRAVASAEIERRHYLELQPTDREIFEARLKRREIVQLETKQDGEDEEDTPRVPRTNRVRTAATNQQNVREQAGANDSAPTSTPLLRNRELDERDLPRISPSDLPQLLTASADSRTTIQGLRGVPGSSAPPRDITSDEARIDGSSRGLLGSEQQVLRGQSEVASLDRTLQPPRQPRVIEESSTTASSFKRKSNPYANVPSLYDLYAQAPPRGGKLERFGESIFQNGTGNLEQLPMDVPVGPDYVVGPGDGINIEMWGSISQRLQRVVDREGRVALPEVGLVQVSGKTLAQMQQLLQSELRTEFRDVQADVSLARLRTVRVYVVGDATNPGAYDISALSTPLNALYAAGGPTSGGSMRLLKHYRGKQLVEDVDVYDLILRGVRGDLQPLQPGDTILVPPLHPEVAVEGMVRRPALYELKDENTLDEVLELAGGVLPSGTLRHIDVERVEAHEKRTMLSLDLPDGGRKDDIDKALAQFKIQDGDKIRISPILPYAEKSVYLDGHVFRPGKYAYREGMKVSDLIKSYADLLPEPYRAHAEVIRLNAPDFKPVVVGFNLSEALNSKSEGDIALKPFDTVRVFGRFDFEDPPEVTVTGEVRSPGSHRTSGELRVRDAVYLAGGVTPDALLSDAQVSRRLNGQIQVMSINLGRALNGEASDNLLLQPKDRLIIHRNLARLDPPMVKIEGEVANPGKYPLADRMTATELVRLAGGLKRGAYTDSADLARYSVEGGKRFVGEHQQIELAKAFTSPEADVTLRDGDTLSIGQIPGFKDFGATVSVQGEVLHPSSYGIKEGERLSSILLRAGGFRADAYPQGIVLIRESLREMEEKNRTDLIRRLEDENSSQKYAPGTNPNDQISQRQSFLLQQEQIISRVKNEPAMGRLVVRISADIRRWQGTPVDVELRKGDVITIPKRPTQVMISGQVYNPSAITFVPGKSAGWYLRQAGGANELANKKSIFIVRADGSIVGRGSGSRFWSESVSNTVLQPGDSVIVPERLLGGTPVFKTLLESAQIVSSIAIAAKAVGAF